MTSNRKYYDKDVAFETGDEYDREDDMLLLDRDGLVLEASGGVDDDDDDESLVCQDWCRRKEGWVEDYWIRSRSGTLGPRVGQSQAAPGDRS